MKEPKKFKCFSMQSTVHAWSMKGREFDSNAL